MNELIDEMAEEFIAEMQQSWDNAEADYMHNFYDPKYVPHGPHTRDEVIESFESLKKWAGRKAALADAGSMVTPVVTVPSLEEAHARIVWTDALH